MAVYDIHTNLDPEQLTTVAMEIYRQWISFALGRLSIGGKYLKHPTGKYASAISWKKTGAYKVTVMADSNIAKEVDSIENGAPAYNLKDTMLAAKSKVGADGHRYRIVRMPDKPEYSAETAGMPSAGTIDSVISSSRSNGRITGQTTKPKRGSGLAKIWGMRAERTGFKTMTDAPGSSPWIIPARPAYAPAKILSDLLRQDYGK